MTVNIIYPTVDRSIKDRLRMVKRLTMHIVSCTEVPDFFLFSLVAPKHCSQTIHLNHEPCFPLSLSFGATGQQVSLIVTMETRLLVQS